MMLSENVASTSSFCKMESYASAFISENGTILSTESTGFSDV